MSKQTHEYKLEMYIEHHEYGGIGLDKMVKKGWRVHTIAAPDLASGKVKWPFVLFEREVK